VIGYFSGITHKSSKYYAKYERNRIFNRCNISEIYDDLKSGDIILFKGYGNPYFNILCDCFFQHAGMIIRYTPEEAKQYGKKSDVYIIESSPNNVYLPIDYVNDKKYGKQSCNIEPDMSKRIGWKFKDGLVACPLLIRLKYYYGNCYYIMRLNKELNPEMKINLLNITNIKNIHIGAISTIQKIFNAKKIVFHCFQFILFILDQMRITDNYIKKSNVFTSCNKLSYIYNDKLHFGYKYDKPMQILYDL
jgi:hypothetical protein